MEIDDVDKKLLEIAHRHDTHGCWALDPYVLNALREAYDLGAKSKKDKPNGG